MRASAPPSASSERWRRLDRIARVTADFYNVDVDDLRGPRTYQSLARPRRIVSYLMREMGASLIEIGRYMHRDHTSILAQLRKGVGEEIPHELRDRLAVGGGCIECRGLRVELAALKLEILELRSRFGGGGGC